MNAPPLSVTQPLGLRQFMRTQPSVGFDFISLLDLIVIAILLGFNGSNFVFAPGAEVELARTTHPELGGQMASVVLTVGRNDALFFEGRKISVHDLPARLKRAAASYENEPVLLLKLDRSLDLETVFNLMDSAREAGFQRVQLAGEEAEGQSSLLP